MARSLILRRSTSHFNKAIIRVIESSLLIDLVFQILCSKMSGVLSQRNVHSLPTVR